MITTKELILKDFASETSDDKIFTAYQQMVKSLAGNLAIVTGKEPFRVELTKQLSDLLRN
eukprot:CAMPEP_0168313286 /NCGR_PEP_ID=MMETSP0210-20121227/932_1 /TAXON_ID=40633 /ORGANISM="Condylostoma magnum, Strain COL2" /LENGTH=59 /DNA_ID=CAMNT_0008267977 /DNA_START=3207 /DNA_END=3386 /DNA_ORIENTATION=+